MFKLNEKNTALAEPMMTALEQLSEALRFTVPEGDCTDFDAWLSDTRKLISTGYKLFNAAPEAPEAPQEQDTMPTPQDSLVIEVEAGDNTLPSFDAPQPKPAPQPQVSPVQGGTCALFTGISFYKDDELNGDINDIFKWVLNADPMTCTAETLVRACLLCREDRNGKASSLTRPQIVEIFNRRGFAGWPTTKKAQTDKLRIIIEKLKAAEDFTAKRVKDISKNFPTLASYDQEQFDLLTAAKTCTVPGDDLDEMFESIKAGLTVTPVELGTDTQAIEDKISKAHRRLGL